MCTKRKNDLCLRSRFTVNTKIQNQFQKITFRFAMRKQKSFSVSRMRFGRYVVRMSGRSQEAFNWVVTRTGTNHTSCDIRGDQTANITKPIHRERLEEC